MKKVKKVRKSGENIERSESQFYFALAFTQFISENVRLCRIAFYMYMRRGQNRQRPKKGVADVRGYNTMGQVVGFPSFRDFERYGLRRVTILQSDQRRKL